MAAFHADDERVGRVMTAMTMQNTSAASVNPREITASKRNVEVWHRVTSISYWLFCTLRSVSTPHVCHSLHGCAPPFKWQLFKSKHTFPDALHARPHWHT
jgi:hypothetical protein